jgi:malonyl-CoA O-methyltransferase
MLVAYEQFRQENRLPATYEVIYGHAWKATRSLIKPATEGNIVSIPVDSLRRKGQGRDNT